jgi:hypothetical protein
MFCSRLFSVFTFTFLVDRRGLFALVDVTVTSGDAGALGVAEPRIFVWTVSAGLHVSGVGDVSYLERQRAFIAGVARLLGGGCLLAAVPRVECAQLFVLLRVGDPLKCLSCRDEPNVGPESRKFARQITISWKSETNSQLRCPIEELVQALLEFLDLEPVGVEGHHVRRLVLLVVAREVLLQPLKHLISVVIVQHALIEIGTNAALERLDEMRV